MSPTHQDLSNDTTLSQIKSRVPAPLKYRHGTVIIMMSKFWRHPVKKNIQHFESSRQYCIPCHCYALHLLESFLIIAKCPYNKIKILQHLQEAFDWYPPEFSWYSPFTSKFKTLTKNRHSFITYLYFSSFKAWMSYTTATPIYKQI